MEESQSVHSRDVFTNSRSVATLINISERLARMEGRWDAVEKLLNEMREESRAQHASQRADLQALEKRVTTLEEQDSRMRNRIYGGLAVLSIAWPIIWEKTKKYLPGF